MAVVRFHCLNLPETASSFNAVIDPPSSTSSREEGLDTVPTSAGLIPPEASDTRIKYSPSWFIFHGPALPARPHGSTNTSAGNMSIRKTWRLKRGVRERPGLKRCENIERFKSRDIAGLSACRHSSVTWSCFAEIIWEGIQGRSLRKSSKSGRETPGCYSVLTWLGFIPISNNNDSTQKR